MIDNRIYIRIELFIMAIVQFFIQRRHNFTASISIRIVIVAKEKRYSEAHIKKQILIACVHL